MRTRKNGKWYIHEELTEADLIEISKKDMDLYKVLTRTEIEPIAPIEVVEVKKKKSKK